MTGRSADGGFIRVAQQRADRKHVCGSAAAHKNNAGIALAESANHIRGGGGVLVRAIGGVLLAGEGTKRLEYVRRTMLLVYRGAPLRSNRS